MSKLSRGIGAAVLCLGMLFSASIIMATQDPAMKTPKTAAISGTVTAVTDSA